MQLKSNNIPIFSDMESFYKSNSDGKTDDGPCGIDAAAVHTRMINKIQKEFNIRSVKKELLKEEGKLLYAQGLYEHLVEMYKNTDLLLDEFYGE